MNRTERTILAGCVALILLAMVLNAIAPKEADWNRSFSRYRTDPYACGLTYDRLTDLFPQGAVTVRRSIYGTAQERLALDSTAPRVNHIFVDRTFAPNDLDQRHLLMMVAAGDDAFIAAEEIIGKLTDTLKFTVEHHWAMPDSATVVQDAKAMLVPRPDQVRFTVRPLRASEPSTFVRGGLDAQFGAPGSDSLQVLAENQRGAPVLLRIKHGKGSLYLCTAPLAFTNYYLLKDESRRFMTGCFNLLPDRPVLWDEFYKSGAEGGSTPLRYLLSQPALRIAYWTAIALLLLTVFVHARRRQRAIPVLEPLRNTSRDLAETMGRLYYFKGDHADLARKLVAQFKEITRRELRLHHTRWDAATITEIARLTGIGTGELEHAGRLMDHYSGAEHVSEEQLINLNKTLSGLRRRMEAS